MGNVHGNFSVDPATIGVNLALYGAPRDGFFWLFAPIFAAGADHAVDMVLEAMLDVGIDGFISKRQGDADELAEAIRTIMSGLEYFGRDISAIIYDVFVSKKKTTIVTPEFTEREKEIILACRDGLLCKEIAARLGISTHTVNTHKNNIFTKLGINNTMEMVQYALKKGIIRVRN
jgi:DNA-binding NarL/FixJ family response regulator